MIESYRHNFCHVAPNTYGQFLKVGENIEADTNFYSIHLHSSQFWPTKQNKVSYYFLQHFQTSYSFMLYNNFITVLFALNITNIIQRQNVENWGWGGWDLLSLHRMTRFINPLPWENWRCTCTTLKFSHKLSPNEKSVVINSHIL